MIDVIIPTIGSEKYEKCKESLSHLPLEYTLHTITNVSPYPKAINQGITKSSNDVLLIDDDVIIQPDTFKDFDDYYPHADLFGFKLLFPDGRIQHAGGFVSGKNVGHLGYGLEEGFDTFKEVASVTSALMYIKRETIDKVGLFDEVVPYFTDAAYCYRAQYHGLKVACIPTTAIHDERQGDRGDEYRDKMAGSYAWLQANFLHPSEFRNKLEALS